MSGKIFKIIIVDDDLDDHYLIKDAFKQLKFPFELIALYNGMELIEYFEAHAKQGTKEFVDFIIMDINMPTLDGVVALSRIKKEERLRQIPVFMLSTTRDESAYKECLNLGALDFYIKPDSSGELKRILSGMFERIAAFNSLRP